MLVAISAPSAASAFDNQTCQAFLTGLWKAEGDGKGDANAVDLLALTKSGEALGGRGIVPHGPKEGHWLLMKWSAKPGSAPERCILITTGVNRSGGPQVDESELSVVDDNTINIYAARMNYTRQ